MRARRFRVRLVSLVSLILLVAALVLWLRTREYGDIVGFYTPAGHLQALASDRAGFLIFLSDVPFGREYRLSADAMSVPADEFNQLHDWLYDKTREKWHFAGFRLAQGKLDLTASMAPKYTALIVPYWLLAALFAVAPLGSFRRLLIRHLRRRRRQCLNCGYDLRHSAERCPECGTTIAKDSAVTRTGETSRATRPSVKTILYCLVAAGAATGTAWALRHFRHERRELMEAARASVLDRRIAELNLRGATLKQAIDQLARLTGARIAIKQKVPQPAPRAGGSSVVLAVPDYAIDEDSTSDLNLRDVRLGAVLDVLVREFSSQPGSLAHDVDRDGTICVAPVDSLDPVVRVYDIRDILAKFPVDSPFPAAAVQLVPNMLTFYTLPSINDGRLVAVEARPTQRLIELTLAQLRRMLSGKMPPAMGFERVDKPIGEVRVDKLTLAELAEAVAAQSKTSVAVDLPAFEALGISRDLRVSYRLRHATPRSALSAWLLTAGYEPPVDYSIYDNVIFVSPSYPPRDYLAVRGHDVDDLLARYTRYFDAHPTMEMSDPGPVFLRLPPTDREQAEQGLYQTIIDLVEPDSWRENGGIASIYMLSGRLITINSPQVDAEVERLLETLRRFERASVRGGEVPWAALPGESWVMTKLEQRLPEFRLDSVPLTQALEKISDIAGVDIVFNRRAFWNISITLHLRDVPLHEAMSTMLRLASQPVGLHYSVRDGFICVNTGAEEDELLTRIYDVCDLIDVEDLKTHRSADASSRPQVHNPMGQLPLPDARDVLIGTIFNGVEPESWKSNGGRASARALAGLLIITTTMEDHRQVEALLGKLRQTYGNRVRLPERAPSAR